MALNFTDKQMWVSVLESLAERSQIEVDGIQKNKLNGKSIWTLKGDKLIDPNCTTIFDENIILMGATEGLFMLKIINKFTCSLKYRMEGIDCVYQIACVEEIGVVILIHGEDRKLSLGNLDAFRSALHSSSNQMPALRSVTDVKDCHLFALENICTDSPYICIATSDTVKLFQWEPTSKKFYSKKVIETNEPCSCIHFSQNSVIFGTDGFYELNLEIYTLKRFLDSKDASLAGLVYGASHFRSFPIAIFQIAPPEDPEEYLLCFHEMGVFVNELGQRTRHDDMKWSRLPLSFAYRCPYIFVTHFSSIEVIEIPPQNVTESGIRGVMPARNPQYMGPAHVEQSIFISSIHDRTIELILVDGKSIGSSHYDLQNDEITTAASNTSDSSSKGSIAESDGLDFSFSTSVNQSLEQSIDQLSLSSKASEESTNSQLS